MGERQAMNLCECGCGQHTNIYKGKARRYLWGHAMRANLGAVQSGLAKWRETPEGRQSIAAEGVKKAERLRSPEHRAAVSRASLGRENTKDVATIKPSIRDLAWAAGFLEGEGSFFAQEGKYAQVTATQVQLEPLERLVSMFGGRVWHRKSRGPRCSPTGWWRVSGSRARGVAMTLFAFMSPRRKDQIRAMLGATIG